MITSIFITIYVMLIYKKVDHIQSNTPVKKNTLKTLKHGFAKGDILAILLRNRLKRPFRLSPSDENNSKKVNGVHQQWHIIQHLKILLYADEQVQKVLSPVPFVYFRSTRNLKSYLVRSKNYPLERKVGSEKCNSKRCLVC